MAKETKTTLKPGAYICIVREGFAFFNKRSYEYGQRIVVDSEELLEKMGNAGDRFVPEAEFIKEDGDVVRKVISASRNNKSVEDVIRTADAEKAKMRADYEAKIKELQRTIDEAEAKKAEAEGKKADTPKDVPPLKK